ncbi:MAG: hypothetical protein E7353_03250 [Clostridiales bacterium]|nr:hypothetical protein [Clostridiales bacterium]
MNNNEDKRFSYTYTAPTEEERREIDSIRKKYVQQTKKETSKMERLRSLDAKVRNSALVIALTLGVVGVLLFGFGLTCVLEWNLWVLGISCMVVGCVPVGIAYPIHGIVLAKNRKKYGDEILALTEELLNEDNLEEKK